LSGRSPIFRKRNATQPSAAPLDKICRRNAAPGHAHDHCQHLAAALQTNNRIACFSAATSANRQVSKAQPACQPNAIAVVLKINKAIDARAACQQERIAAAAARKAIVACAAQQRVVALSTNKWLAGRLLIYPRCCFSRRYRLTSDTGVLV
jgi:hypothetical protein